jgi:hypothetical protein
VLLALKRSGAERISISGLLALIIFLFQLSPLLLPVLGTLLSSAVTLVVACSIILLKKQGFIIYISAAFMLLCVSPVITVEYILTTGLSGLIMGLCFWKKPACTFFLTSLTFLAGMFCLTYMAGNITLNGLFGDMPVLITIPFFAVFSIVYTGVSMIILKRLMKLPSLRMGLQN